MYCTYMVSSPGRRCISHHWLPSLRREKRNQGANNNTHAFHTDNPCLHGSPRSSDKTSPRGDFRASPTNRGAKETPTPRSLCLGSAVWGIGRPRERKSIASCN